MNVWRDVTITSIFENNMHMVNATTRREIRQEEKIRVEDKKKKNHTNIIHALPRSEI